MKRFLTVFLALALLLSLAVPAAAFNKSKRSTQNLMVNGKPVACEKYNIDGSNYFMLRDLAKLLNGTESQFDVGWDPAKKLVTLTTNHAYTTERGDELKVGEDQSATTVESRDALVIDGVQRSDIAAYKIGGSNFFKLRDLGDALGFDVDYIEKTRTATVASRSSIEVTDLCNIAGQYIEDGGYVYNYSFVLPKISGLDTAYIRSVNAEMQGLYDSYVSETLWHMEEDNSLTRFCISYSYTVKNGVHSLLVTADSDWDMNEYRCYHFDALGNELDNAAVLAAAGWTADDFLQRARAYLKERTDISAYFVDDGWKQYQEQTLSPENLNADIPMTILPDGELCFVCTVYTPAGAGEYDEAFALAEDGTVSVADVGSTLLDRLRGCYLAQDAGAEEATLYELVTIGEGTIICAHTIITVNISIGEHVIINLDCTIGHDAIIEDYVTLYPSVNVSGFTHIGHAAELGVGMQIIQRKSIGDYSIVGAGAVVVKDIPAKCTAVGIPAKPIKFFEEQITANPNIPADTN